jgi:hypothetical protein
MRHPTTKKRGADPHVPPKAKNELPNNETERKLEQGLEETMAGSDAVSVIQPSPGKSQRKQSKL